MANAGSLGVMGANSKHEFWVDSNSSSSVEYPEKPGSSSLRKHNIGLMDFLVGEKVIYPNHGVGIIEKINQREVSGRQESFYQLKIISNSMMVMIPTANVADVGLRKLIKKEVVNQLLEHLKKSAVTCAADWKNRFKENSEKMRTGCIFDVADVFKGLQALSHTRILSFREKKMLDRARYLLISEVATVWNISEGRVEELIDRALVGKDSKRANA
jgi:CarD family transcriptional regulator